MLHLRQRELPLAAGAREDAEPDHQELSVELAQIAKQPDVIERYAAFGMLAVGSTPERNEPPYAKADRKVFARPLDASIEGSLPRGPAQPAVSTSL